MPIQYLIIAPVAYLLGSIPFGYLLMKLLRGTDVRTTGSGNIGATNVARSDPKLGVLTLLLDAAKGFLAAMAGYAIARTWEPDWDAIWHGHEKWILGEGTNVAMTGIAIAALFAVLGHMFPVWLKFKGGKGVATAVGALLILDARAVLVSFVVFVLAVLLTRFVSLGSILAAITFPIAMKAFDLTISRHNRPPLALLMVLMAVGFIIAKHHENIRRILAGNENKLGARKPA